MNREQYLQLRNGLYNEAEALINEGKIDMEATYYDDIYGTIKKCVEL